MADVRVHNAGDQPTKSPTSTLLQPEAGTELTNQLSYLLDKERNESLEYELAIPIATTPSHIVATMLSTKPVITSNQHFPFFTRISKLYLWLTTVVLVSDNVVLSARDQEELTWLSLLGPRTRRVFGPIFKPTSLSERHSNRTITLNATYTSCSRGFQSQTLTGEIRTVPFFQKSQIYCPFQHQH
jgi:hypothetical protein